MRKSKYLILNSFYFKNFHDLEEIIKARNPFLKQNLLDLSRFDSLKIINSSAFNNHNINFIFLPKLSNRILCI